MSEFTAGRLFDWRFAFRAAATIPTRSIWITLLLAVLVVWAVASAVFRLMAHDPTWWVDPVVAVLVPVVVLAALAVRLHGGLSKAGMQFGGNVVRTTLAGDRLLISGGHLFAKLNRADIRAVAVRFGVVRFSLASGELVLPREAFDGDMVRDLQDAARAARLDLV